MRKSSFDDVETELLILRGSPVSDKRIRSALKDEEKFMARRTLTQIKARLNYIKDTINRIYNNF